MIFEFTYESDFGGRYWPHNDSAKILVKLMKRSTLTHANVALCKKAGWNIQIIQPQGKNEPKE
jgi:hypothetical protein